MLDFSCDYNNGAHPYVLERLIATNGDTTATYGTDVYCASAADKIREACCLPEASVYFICGGTQTNLVVISSLLRTYEGVISAATGHINCHEAGAVEATGHKVLTLPHRAGKIDPDELSAYLKTFYADGSRDHMVFPRMVYLSYPTEYGTVYKKDELVKIRRICDEYGLYLFVDGARLGYGLMCDECDTDLPTLSSLCDVMYIGGTKIGALCGEAVVFRKEADPGHFMTHVKQRGAMLAKGRLLGVQFDALFTDGLYFKISKNAIDQAKKLKSAFQEHGYRLFIDSPTNQQFVIMENVALLRLSEKVRFEVWEPYDGSHTVVRFVTSWRTADKEIEELAGML